MKQGIFSKFSPRVLLLRRIFLVSADLAGMLLGFWLVSFAMPYYPGGTGPLNLNTALALSLVNLVIYFICGLYSSLWEYSGTRELLQISVATFIATVADLLIGLLIDNRLRFVQYIFVWIILTLFCGGIRMSYRLLRFLKNWTSARSRRANRRIMLIGADNHGALLASRMQEGTLKIGTPVVFLDDNERKIGRRIHGVKVFGGLDRLDLALRLYSIDEIVVTNPHLPHEVLTKIYDASVANSCDLKISQELEEILVSEGDKEALLLREFDVNDLLGRQLSKLNTERIYAHVNDKTVLITGGGGSIGSEIARQLAKYNPAVIILFDVYENLVFEVKNHLSNKYGDHIRICVEIGSIQDVPRLERLFKAYRPDLVFHAAAHKHVPLMECNPGRPSKTMYWARIMSPA